MKSIHEDQLIAATVKGGDMLKTLGSMIEGMNEVAQRIKKCNLVMPPIRAPGTELGRAEDERTNRRDCKSMYNMCWRRAYYQLDSEPRIRRPIWD